jgi:hypothetical protein
MPCVITLHAQPLYSKSRALPSLAAVVESLVAPFKSLVALELESRTGFGHSTLKSAGRIHFVSAAHTSTLRASGWEGVRA